MICASSVTDFHPLATWVGIISRLTMQRYNSVPRDVKRHPRFGGDLTLRGLVIFSDEVLNNSSECSEESECASKKYYIADVYRFFGPLRMTRNGSSCLLAIFVPFNICKIGICKDNSYLGRIQPRFHNLIQVRKLNSCTPYTCES